MNVKFFLKNSKFSFADQISTKMNIRFFTCLQREQRRGEVVFKLSVLNIYAKKNLFILDLCSELGLPVGACTLYSVHSTHCPSQIF